MSKKNKVKTRPTLHSSICVAINPASNPTPKMFRCMRCNQNNRTVEWRWFCFKCDQSLVEDTELTLAALNKK